MAFAFGFSTLVIFGCVRAADLDSDFDLASFREATCALATTFALLRARQTSMRRSTKLTTDCDERYSQRPVTSATSSQENPAAA